MRDFLNFIDPENEIPDSIFQASGPKFSMEVAPNQFRGWGIKQEQKLLKPSAQVE